MLSEKDKEIKSIIGKVYDENTRHLLRYGGTVNSNGIVIEAYTEEEAKKFRCERGSNKLYKLLDKFVYYMLYLICFLLLYYFVRFILRVIRS